MEQDFTKRKDLKKQAAKWGDDFLNKVLNEAPKINGKRWINCLSIDPGENLGFAFGRYHANIEKGEIEVVLDKKRTTSTNLDFLKGLKTEDLHRPINSWIMRTFKMEELNCCDTIIERQYIMPPGKNPGAWAATLRLQIIQSIIFSVLHSAYGAFVNFENSKELKQNMGIATGNYTQNKKAALQFCETILKKEDFDNHIATNHHVADSINQLYYRLKTTHETTFQKPFVVTVTFESFE
jgi:hypothetical protein